MSTTLDELVARADAWLAPDSIQDYCPNGLQVGGRSRVQTLVTGVTACQALLEAAWDAGADALLVHHGYFWKGESPRVVGMRKRRLKTLLTTDMSLLAYHLPLDVHPEYGNNVQLAQLLGWVVEGALDPRQPSRPGLRGRPSNPLRAGALAREMAKVLGREPLLIGDPNQRIASLGWCTGAAQGGLEQAVATGLDAYISGEISEPTVHTARESGVCYLAAGHHATERYGVQALGRALAEVFDLEHRFIDIENPV